MKIGRNGIKENRNEHPNSKEKGCANWFHATFARILDDSQRPEKRKKAPGVKVSTDVQNVIDIILSELSSLRPFGMRSYLAEKGSREEA